MVLFVCTFPVTNFSVMGVWPHKCIDQKRTCDPFPDCRCPLHCSHTHLAAGVSSRSLDYGNCMLCAFGMVWWLFPHSMYISAWPLMLTELLSLRVSKNWAWAMFKGIRGMDYDMVITTTDLVQPYLPAGWKSRCCVARSLIIVLERVPLRRLVCVHI
jgi:hypothetical protein